MLEFNKRLLKRYVNMMVLLLRTWCAQKLWMKQNDSPNELSFEIKKAVTSPKHGCHIHTFRQSFAQVLFILMNKYWASAHSIFSSFFIPYARKTNWFRCHFMGWFHSWKFFVLKFSLKKWTQWRENTSTSQNCCKFSSLIFRTFQTIHKENSGPPPSESIRYMLFLTIAH